MAGYRSPPFRPLTPAEDAADIAAINETEPDFVWVGLGMPKQEKWMVEHLGKVNATALIGVGAPSTSTRVRNLALRFGCSARGWNGYSGC